MKVKRKIMEKNKKYLFLIITATVIFFLCCIFWPFIYTNIISPLSLCVWLLLRLTILSIDQRNIWFVVILANIFFLVIRINSLTTFQEENTNLKDINSYINNLEIWKHYFSSEKNSSVDMNNLKKRLLSILVTAYASKKRVPVNYKLYDKFRNKEIPLPDDIYNFLIDDGKNKKNGVVLKFRRPAELLYIVTGKLKKDYNRKIEECLNFLENYLEIKDEYKTTEENHH